MTPMHPHWHATDDSEEQVVPVSVDSVSAPALTATPKTIRTASRKPAAIVGILLVGAFGYAAFLNTGSLQGQVASSNTISLHLTAEGAVPVSLNAVAGDTVQVFNDDTIPHILSFANLQTGGKALETSPIFPGSTVMILLPKTTATGKYSYVSKTSKLAGDIVVGTTPSAPAVTAQSSSKMSALAASSASAFTQSSQATSLKAVTAVLPVNRHTVDSPGQTAVEPLHSGAPKTIISQHKPVTNTSSGPATWLLVAVATVAVLLVTRKAFR